MIETKSRRVAKPKVQETVLIHFVADGFTAFGYVWQPGQELEFEVGSAEYERTLDVDGKSWLDLTEREQEDRWGEVKFKLGESDIPNAIIAAQPFAQEHEYKWNMTPGISSSNAHTSAKNLEAAANAEIRRGRSVPKV